MPLLVGQSDSGACTGEDGVGRGRLKYLEVERDPEAIDAMRAPKKAVDPQNIFDRDKIVPLRRSLASAAAHHVLSMKLPQ